MRTGISKGVAIVEWEASPAGDMIADAVVALLMHAQSSAASIRLTSKPCRHSRPEGEGETDGEPASKKAKESEKDATETRLRIMHETLKKQFETVEAVYEGKTASFEIKLDTALESGVELDDDGILTCTAKVEFEDDLGVNAVITVECADKKIASNVQDCLRNLSTSLAPISI